MCMRVCNVFDSRINKKCSPTYWLSLVDVFINRQSAYLWVTNCVPLLADLFLYSYEAYFIQVLLKKNKTKLVRSFNFTFRNIDDALSINNSRFGDFVDRIYLIELQIKDTTDTDRSASYLDLHLAIDRNCTTKKIIAISI